MQKCKKCCEMRLPFNLIVFNIQNANQMILVLMGYASMILQGLMHPMGPLSLYASKRHVYTGSTTINLIRLYQEQKEF